jgi:hypothetical protein
MKTIAQEEWYFDRFERLPDSQVEGCLLYELTREVCRSEERILAYLRRIEILKSGGADVAKLVMTQGGFRSTHFHLATFAKDNFKTPFQRLSYSSRKAFCDNLPKVFREDVSQLDDKHAFQHIEARNFDRTDKDYTFACFEIHWSKENEELCAQFLQWLKDNRRGREGRALQPITKMARTTLRALGARRLMKASGNAIIASDIAKEATGDPIYSDNPQAIGPAWSRAKAKADAAIKAHRLTFPKSA